MSNHPLELIILKRVSITQISLLTQEIENYYFSANYCGFV